MADRQFSRELRRKMEQGLRIAVSAKPYRGKEVVYAPRSRTDNRPWVLKSRPVLSEPVPRFSGRECHAERFFVRNPAPLCFEVVDSHTGKPVSEHALKFRADDRAYDLNYPGV
jgi:hypothetical protein